MDVPVPAPLGNNIGGHLLEHYKIRVACFNDHPREYWTMESTPEGTLGYVTGAQEAGSTKRSKKMGSSVAYKTIGTVLSQNMGHEDACGWATEMQSSGCAAVRQWPTLRFIHWTCKFDLDSEFIRYEKELPPPPPRVYAKVRN